ncbi:MAG: fused MFS/spermidine synthase [Candidatus Sumerlaeia bacterium]|nr:fused MFS/spermidine synthase [Candidatus Sumerlaeia bacterium]
MESTNRNPVTPTIPLLIVALMFILSGASGLMYEVIWTRKLTTFFGSTLYGVATVLSAFMGGLALGSYLLGKRADKMRYPLSVYGIYEVLIALAALAFPFALKATQPLIGAVYVTGGERTFFFFSMFRFVIVFILLMIPTTMMGATLPILSKAVTENLSKVGRRVGWLYALNTTGAVLGVFTTGFILLELLGVWYTTLLGVGVNIAIGIAAIILGRKYFTKDPDAPPPAVELLPTHGREHHEVFSKKAITMVLVTYAISGFIALAYQVAWTRALIFSFDRLKATTYSFSGMLVVFLLGLAIGSWIMQGLVDKQRNLLRLYALLQAGIGLGGALSWFMIVRDWNLLPEQIEDGTLIYWNAVANVMITTGLAIGLPTILMGMAFPVVSRIVVCSVHQIGFDVARVYSLNTVGAILGSFLGGFFLVPLFGITGTIALLASLNLLMAGFLFAVNGELSIPVRRAMAVGAVLLAVLIPYRIASSGSYLQRLQPNEIMIHYEEGAMATISVVENNSGDRTIYVDNVGVAGTDKVLLTDQKSLAHVPMVLLGGEAKNVLSVGFGSGGASYSYTLYDNIENIYTIEIAPEVLRAAHVLTDSSHGIIFPDRIINEARAAGADRITGSRHPVSSYVHTPVPGFKTFDPRLSLIVEDARSYLRFTDKQFDVIATDCTDLRYKSNANLYDLEYFQLCRERITDDGLVVVWMPLAGLSDRAFRTALRTFQEVFPEMTTWYFTNQPTHYCLLIGGKGPLQIDYEAIVRAAQLPGIDMDLEEIGLRNPEKLLSSFVNDERTLIEFLDGYPLNTENWPIIEFESPRYGYDARPLRENMERLYQRQVPVADIVYNLPDDPGILDRLWDLQQANHVVFQGHSEYREFNFTEAARLYMKAQEMVPFDDSIAGLLDFGELRRHFETSLPAPNLNTFWIGHSLGSVYLMQDRFSDAVTILEPLTSVIENYDLNDPVMGEEFRRLGRTLNTTLADVYSRAGREPRAEEARRRAERFRE